jgi:chromate transporter
MGPPNRSNSKKPAKPAGNWREVFLGFLRLGLTSFGGPIAHLGYFHDDLVVRRKWLDEKSYADLVALCQFLPGPASSKVGIAVGLSRAGYPGAFAAWFGFTMPSALALLLFAYGISSFGDAVDSNWLHGLKVAAVAVVAQAALLMMRSLAPDRARATLAIAAAAIVLAVPSTWGQITAIALGGIVGFAILRTSTSSDRPAMLPHVVTRSAAVVAVAMFFGILLGSPLVAAAFPNQIILLFDTFYRAGSLVFGGGHVVLPLLQASVVPPGWVTNDAFLAG